MAYEMSDNKILNYEIYKYSSYSTSYLPENIREDCPSNQTSRWSSNTNSPPQFLTLKLQRPAIVKRVKFGKYEKTHVCNLRKFKIFGGLEEDHLILLFEGGLKNDSVPETFNVRHTTETGRLLPVIFIQIMPLLSWGPSFNFSIWYVELLGQDDPIFVRSSLRGYNMLREVEIVRLCLKHFRQQGYETAYRALQDQTNVHLEHQMMTDLHNALVINGDFSKTEEAIEKCVDDGLMDSYLSKQYYKASWMLQNTDVNDKRPGMRGGHQLIMDSVNCIMYLYGGWDGFEDLSDLWSYDIRKNQWSLLQERSELCDGPTPRSCHKMVFDSCNSQIFTLGRYLDNASRTKEYIKSDFYLYDTAAKSWLQISDDTSQVGGPKLMFDHQMCIDVAKRTIYVFGGRILTPRNIDELSNEPQYSGLFSFHIGTNTWREIIVDCGHSSASNPQVLSIKSRVTHSMLFHHRLRKLYIFGGLRNKEFTTDFISFNVDSEEISVINSDDNVTESKNVPQCGFTQRATIDCERDEIYVLSSLSKEKERRDFNLNSFWMYSLKTNEWTCIYKSDHSNCCIKSRSNSCIEPCPRYAHQLVYDWTNRLHYLFGGNPGKNLSPQLRLDDFWILKLEKPSRQQILSKCKYLIRRLEYEEITKSNSLNAVYYLQTKLSEVINHTDPAQLMEFHKLAGLLFKNDFTQSDQSSSMTVPLGVGNLWENNNNDDECISMGSIDDAPDGKHSKCNSTICLYGNWSIACGRNSPYSLPKITDIEGGATKVFANKQEEQLFEIKNQRCLLYNKLVALMPESMVQPKNNLSDFVLI